MTLQQPEVMVDSFEGDFFWGEISLVTSFPAPLFDGSETNHPPRVRLIKRAKAMLKERLYSSCIMRKYYLGNGVTWKNSQIFFLLTFFLWSDFFSDLGEGKHYSSWKNVVWWLDTVDSSLCPFYRQRQLPCPDSVPKAKESVKNSCWKQQNKWFFQNTLKPGLRGRWGGHPMTPWRSAGSNPCLKATPLSGLDPKVSKKHNF